MNLTRPKLQPAAKAALEQHPLFANGRVPVLTNYVPPGERAPEREAAIRDKGACLEISPVLRQQLVNFKRPSLVTSDCTLSVAVRLSPSVATTPVGQPDAPMLTLDTAVDAVIQAMLGVGFNPKVPFDGFEPANELAQLIEDVDGLLSTAVFFVARTQINSPAA